MKLTIFRRLVFGNLVMLGFLVSLGAFVIFKLYDIQQIATDMVDVETRIITRCESLSDNLVSLVVLEKKYMISKDVDYFKKYNEVKTEFEKGLDLLGEMTAGDEAANRSVVMMDKLFDSYSLMFMDAVRRMDEADKEDLEKKVSAFFARRNKVINQINENLEALIKLKNQVKNDNLLRSRAMIRQSIRVTVILTLIALVLGIFISVNNTRAITGAIFLLERKTREIARGQFNQIPESPSAPKEIGELTRHFNVMCSRLKELEVMKTDFISHFSHELRTPVTSIKEAASMLNIRLFKDEPDKEAELSLLILNECERLTGSIEKILDLSRMEVFEMGWSFHRADMIKVIEKSLAKFRPEATKKKINLVFLPGKNLPELSLDEKRIEEVLNNLISNALKYTPEKGNISIEVETCEEKNQMVVCVADNGCGIGENDLESIFEKFKRIDVGNETLRGTGLGLAIAKHIINAHKGEIWAESQISKGTKIYFTLPLA